MDPPFDPERKKVVEKTKYNIKCNLKRVAFVHWFRSCKVKGYIVTEVGSSSSESCFTQGLVLGSGWKSRYTGVKGLGKGGVLNGLKCTGEV